MRKYINNSEKSPSLTLSLQEEWIENRFAIGGVTRNASKNIIKNAKRLRKNLPEAKKTLWYHLRAERFTGYKLRRQHPIEIYIVDFMCLKSRLIIELDGGQHSEAIEYDAKRLLFLESHGFRLLRFWNNAIMKKYRWCIRDN